MRKLFKNLALTASLLTLGTGCIRNYESRMEEELRAKGFTEEQAEVGAVMGLRELLMEEKEHENGTVTYEFNYGGVNVDDIAAKVAHIHQDLENLMRDRRDIEKEKFLKTFDLEEHFEHQKEIYGYLDDKISEKRLHLEFLDMMGVRHEKENDDPHVVIEDERYSLGTFFPSRVLSFDAPYVEKARREGKLQRNSDAVVERIVQEYMFLRKVRNPDYPQTDPNNEFIFREQKIYLELVSYDLDGDNEKRVDYIEFFRLKDGLARERHPALKVFKPTTSSNLIVYVADNDFESDQRGFGRPDKVGYVWGVNTGSDLLLKHQDVIKFLFHREEEDTPVQIDKPLRQTYIVRAGEHLFVEYDTNVNGWESNLPSYKEGDHKKWENIETHVHYDSKDKKVKKIDEICLEFLECGERVVEFYHLREPYSGWQLSKVSVNGDGVVELFREGEPAAKYMLRDVVEEKPYRIDFDVGDKRWSIFDNDNDDVHYEDKLEIRKPENLNL